MAADGTTKVLNCISTTMVSFITKIVRLGWCMVSSFKHNQYIKILTCVCLCVCVCVTEVGCSLGGTRL